MGFSWVFPHDKLFPRHVEADLVPSQQHLTIRNGGAMHVDVAATGFSPSDEAITVQRVVELHHARVAHQRMANGKAWLVEFAVGCVYLLVVVVLCLFGDEVGDGVLLHGL